jgi:hypothetical protein
VTIQGEIVLAKFLERKGPSGWYSQDWMSRAVQSLNRVTPNRCVLGPLDADRLALGVRSADDQPELELEVEPGGRQQLGSLALGAAPLPHRPPQAARAGVDRRGPAVIADRHPLVVGQSGLSGRKILPIAVAWWLLT